MRYTSFPLAWVKARAALVAALLFSLIQGLRLFHIARLPMERLVGYVPDDAFYYLGLARNFSWLHRWTYDRVSPATGFHLLWGYGLAGIYSVRMRVDFHTMFVLLFVFSTLCLSLALYLICSVVVRHFGAWAVVGVLTIFLTASSLELANYLMEAPLVLLFGAAVFAMVTAGPTNSKRLALTVLFGFLGMVSRSDFGLCTFILTVCCFVFRAPYRKLAAAALLGSSLGLAGVVGHTLLVSGHFYQGSTRAKRKWSKAIDDPIQNPLYFAAQPLYKYPDVGGHRSREDAALVLVICAAGLASCLRSRDRGSKALLAAASMTPIAYICLYRFDAAALQPWYYANFLMPYSIALAGLYSLPGRLWKTLALIAGAVWSVHGVRLSLQPVWPAQRGFYEAALVLKASPDQGEIGTWNAGVLRFFSGANIVNIDGLVNDDADAYILNGDLTGYLRLRNINTLVDDQEMFIDPTFQVRGGYSGSRLTECIRSVEPLWIDPTSSKPGSRVVMARLQADCLR